MAERESSVSRGAGMHLFLLAGQSNMAGRGEVSDEDRTAHPRVFCLNRADEWVSAVDPLHFDKPIAAAGLGRTFGIRIAEQDPAIRVGLIPCAVGGSPISTWEPGVFYPDVGVYPYDDALRRIRVAMQDGRFRAVLWHQGESDANPEAAPAYEARLHALIARFREVTGEPALPFIAGQLGRFSEKPWTEEWELVNAAHAALPEKVPHTAFVSAEGLVHKGDVLHFDTASLREFGRRYAEAYVALAKDAS